MAFEWTSAVAGFLVGATTGATATYLGNKYTDRRRETEADRAARKQFLKTKVQMPKLLAEIKADLAGERGAFVREFFVVEKREHLFGGSEPRFIYEIAVHPDLYGQVSILGNLGYVSDVTPGNTPIYRMSEEFVDLVRQYG